MHRAGGDAIVQDEATDAVFGIPNEAIRKDGVGAVLALGKIAGRLGHRVTAVVFVYRLRV